MIPYQNTNWYTLRKESQHQITVSYIYVIMTSNWLVYTGAAFRIPNDAFIAYSWLVINKKLVIFNLVHFYKRKISYHRLLY